MLKNDKDMYTVPISYPRRLVLQRHRQKQIIPHVELTESNPGSTPALGDRVAYVIVTGNKNTPYL
jgi:hypothetical protein